MIPRPRAAQRFGGLFLPFPPSLANKHPDSNAGGDRCSLYAAARGAYDFVTVCVELSKRSHVQQLNLYFLLTYAIIPIHRSPTINHI